MERNMLYQRWPQISDISLYLHAQLVLRTRVYLPRVFPQVQLEDEQAGNSAIN